MTEQIEEENFCARVLAKNQITQFLYNPELTLYNSLFFPKVKLPL